MCYKNEVLRPIMVNGEFFDIFPKSGHPMIISYVKMDKEILASEKAGGIVSSNKKRKQKLCSINELKRKFDELLCCEEEIINRYGTYNIGIDLDNSVLSNAKIMDLPFQINIQAEERELLIEQLIFDILYYKYRKDSPLMTLRQYSIYQSQYSWSGDQTEANLRIEAVRKCISNALKKDIAVKNSQGLREEIMEMGVNPDVYFEDYGQLSTPFSNGKRQEIRKKSKVQWDQIFYNGNGKLITCKQYDRSFSSNGNYSHKALVNFFDTYDGYVNEVFMQPTANSKDYFLKSLDFYALEKYKRIDFIYKLAVRLGDINMPVISKHHILVKRFHPCVCDVINKNDSLEFAPRIEYYSPMLMLEEVWQKNKLYNEPMYEDKWQKYYFIRAKVYELFKYHCQFVSDDYDDISDFISKHYNILHYHEPNKVWIQEEKKLKADRERRIIKALEINEALFGKSDKRNPRKWEAPANT
ncbi:MAG: hypothetical protein HDR20_08085 [Lachnospiraceae bacterium]|nr:hypothetical protein [Lachnospiraceae bacterium]